MEIKDILNVKPFEESLYKDISLALLTAYSLYLLEEWMMPTTIEAVSVLNFKLFPSKFAMVGFPEYPDALRTNRSLLQLGPKYRKLLTGAAKNGYYLNTKGYEEAGSLKKILGLPELSGKPIKIKGREELPQVERGQADRTIHPEDVMNRVRNSTLYRLYSEKRFEDAPVVHLLSLLQLYENAPAKEKKKRIKEIEVLATQIGDKEVLKFLDSLKKKFYQYIVKE